MCSKSATAVDKVIFKEQIIIIRFQSRKWHWWVQTEGKFS